MDWQTLRNHFMRDIGGDPPGAQLEDQLIAAYAERPDTVEKAMTKIALAFKAGKIRSPWGALKAELEKAAANPTHEKSASRAKAIERARQWIRTAGLHYDRETEIRDELFGERGIIREHANDQTINAMVDLWIELRPLGEQVEHEAEQRAARNKAQRAEIEKTRRATELAAQAAEPTVAIKWTPLGTPPDKPTNPALTPDNHPGVNP